MKSHEPQGADGAHGPWCFVPCSNARLVAQVTEKSDQMGSGFCLVLSASYSLYMRAIV